jgi:hypothetical protein
VLENGMQLQQRNLDRDHGLNRTYKNTRSKVGREGIEPLVATSLFFDTGVTTRPEEHDPNFSKRLQRLAVGNGAAGLALSDATHTKH